MGLAEGEPLRRQFGWKSRRANLARRSKSMGRAATLSWVGFPCLAPAAQKTLPPVVPETGMFEHGWLSAGDRPFGRASAAPRCRAARAIISSSAWLCRTITRSYEGRNFIKLLLGYFRCCRRERPFPRPPVGRNGFPFSFFKPLLDMLVGVKSPQSKSQALSSSRPLMGEAAPSASSCACSAAVSGDGAPVLLRLRRKEA
jgi:hypothetical protein